MKKKQLLLLTGLSLLSAITKTNAQATVASNTLSTATPITNYLGSANDVDILFKRNNVFAGILSNNSVALGVNSIASPNSISIGGNNSASNSTGVYNIFVGFNAGLHNGAGSNNIYIGGGSGANIVGHNNTFIGGSSGGGDGPNIGSNNVFIGSEAGYDIGFEQGPLNDKLVIDNGKGNDNGQLILGDFNLRQLNLNGKVCIGGLNYTHFGDFPTTAGGADVSGYGLFVKGGILAEEVRVSLKSTWADYVFSKDYKLPTLEEVETQIKEKGHLSNVPSAKEIKENGIELGEMSKIQQEKIEELTLYLIEQNKVNQAQNKEIVELKAMLKAILEKK
ncbi:hypothetical protein [Flavobacterium sp. CF136]|uniref:hypothetical protein n=1 Tax=Flavobacterium sp. (strain CF136) TaxID=1144313 RepID=UPI00030368EB|nr:hypothetical protein [Flavobacterium sp. CF136]